jgi:hypothetical protein
MVEREKLRKKENEMGDHEHKKRRGGSLSSHPHHYPSSPMHCSIPVVIVISPSLCPHPWDSCPLSFMFHSPHCCIPVQSLIVVSPWCPCCPCCHVSVVLLLVFLHWCCVLIIHVLVSQSYPQCPDCHVSITSFVFSSPPVLCPR